MKQRQTQVQFSLSLAVYFCSKLKCVKQSHIEVIHISVTVLFSYYINWATLVVKWLLWENVEHSNFNCWLSKGYQLLMSQCFFCFVFIKCRFCHSILLCLEQSSLLLNCSTLYILFLYFWTCFLFCLSALSHIASLFCFCFSPLCFLLCKNSQKSSFIPWISSLYWKIQ